MANKMETCQEKRVQKKKRKLLIIASNVFSITKVHIICPLSEPETSSEKMNN